MSQATSTHTSSASKAASFGPPASPPFQRPVEDVELDDGLDDHALSGDSGSELPASAAEKNMGSLYRKDDDNSSGGGGTKKMSEVANAVSSCLALSFFSISMILANKVRDRVGHCVLLCDRCCALFCPMRSQITYSCTTTTMLFCR